MTYQRLVERTIYRADSIEREIICTLESDDRAGAMRLLETIAERETDVGHSAGHQVGRSWHRGSYWITEHCRAHSDFGRCYTEWRYRLLRPRWPVAPAEAPGSHEDAS